MTGFMRQMEEVIFEDEIEALINRDRDSQSRVAMRSWWSVSQRSRCYILQASTCTQKNLRSRLHSWCRVRIARCFFRGEPKRRL